MVGLQEIRYEAIFQTEWSCFYSITIASYTMSQYEYRRGKAVSVECSHIAKQMLISEHWTASLL